MSRDPDFRLMTRQLHELGIAGSFTRIHHFASPAFASKASTLQQFIAYCESIGDFQTGENPQTIRRGLAVCAAVQRGETLSTAIAKAWEKYPLVTR